MTAMAACLSMPSPNQAGLATMVSQVVEQLFSPTQAAVQHLGPHLRGSTRDRQAQAEALTQVLRGLRRLKSLLAYGSTWLGQAAVARATSAQPPQLALGHFCTQVPVFGWGATPELSPVVLNVMQTGHA